MLWQVPAIGAATQGFLVSAALNKDAGRTLSILLLCVSVVVGVAVIWLFRKLRFHEVADSTLLREYEETRRDSGFAVVHGRRGRGVSAYAAWLVILAGFASLEFVGVVARLAS